MIRNVVMFSGGIGSWAAAKRVAHYEGRDGLILLFADTLVEDDDLYRFLLEASTNVGAPLMRVADGRTPFEVFRDERFIGNVRTAPCSKILKTQQCRQWVESYCDPDVTTLHFGIDWTETHRMKAIERNWSPYKISAPMCEEPYRDKDEMIEYLRAEGIKPPRAYEEGFPHNNCLQQGCVRGGVMYWKHLLDKRPEVFLHTERKEQELREHLETDMTIVRNRRKDRTSDALPLSDIREETDFDINDWGGCGCFVDEQERE